MSAAAVIIIISPRPNRAVAPDEEESLSTLGVRDRVITIDGLYADPTNGEVAQSLQEALSTLAELNPDDPWSGS